MRLLLRINNDQHIDPADDCESLQEQQWPQQTTGDGDKSIREMLELLDTLPATTSAEAFAALRRAFPHSGLITRVEAVKQRWAHCQSDQSSA